MRYSDGTSSVGKRGADVVAKGAFKIPATDVASAGALGRKQLQAASERAAASASNKLRAVKAPERKTLQAVAKPKMDYDFDAGRWVTKPVAGPRPVAAPAVARPKQDYDFDAGKWVTKGFARQSVAPKLARKLPAAGTRGRRFVTGDQNSMPIGKGLTAPAAAGKATKTVKAAVMPQPTAGGFVSALKPQQPLQPAAVGKGVTRRQLAYGAGGAAAAAGLVLPHTEYGQKAELKGKLYGAAYRSQPEFRSLPRSERKARVNSFVDAGFAAKKQREAVGKAAGWRTSEKVPLIARKLHRLYDNPSTRVHESGVRITAFPHSSKQYDALRSKQARQRAIALRAGGSAAAGAALYQAGQRSARGKDVEKAARIKLEPMVRATREHRDASMWPLEALLGNNEESSRLLKARRLQKTKGNVKVIGKAHDPYDPEEARKVLAERKKIKALTDRGISRAAARRMVARGVEAPAKPVQKRRYDPEDERRHRQGLEAGVLGTSGALSIGYGVRGIRNDSRALRNVPTFPAPGPEYKPPAFQRMGNKRVAFEDLPESHQQKLIAETEAKNARRAHRVTLHQASTALKDKRGFLVRGKPAALLAGGAAAVGGAASLHGRRRDSRWD